VIGLFVGSTGTDGYQEMLQISSVQQNVQQLRADSFSDLEFRVTTLAQASVVASVSAPGFIYHHSAVAVLFTISDLW